MVQRQVWGCSFGSLQNCPVICFSKMAYLSGGEPGSLNIRALVNIVFYHPVLCFGLCGRTWYHPLWTVACTAWHFDSSWTCSPTRTWCPAARSAGNTRCCCREWLIISRLCTSRCNLDSRASMSLVDYKILAAELSNSLRSR